MKTGSYSISHSADYSGYAACSGCSLCLLVCPVWHTTRDIRLTPHGRSKALQHGATAHDLIASVDGCTLCGACEPACPEEIDLVGMVVKLRGELNDAMPERSAQLNTVMEQRVSERGQPAFRNTGEICLEICLVPDHLLAHAPALLQSLLMLFGGSAKAAIATDNGADIALALEAGVAIPDVRLVPFLDSLASAKQLVVSSGILLRALRKWMPTKQIDGLGIAVTSLANVRQQLASGDLYVIESSAFHIDRERLIKYYDAIRLSQGCSMNLDLQRLAIPTTAGSLAALLGVNLVDPLAQARWILEGRKFSRIVVESVADLAVFTEVTDKPVLHIAQLL